jgi:tetratricopeptide (TPR) repeat protein
MVHYMMGEEAAAKVALQSARQLARTAEWMQDATDHLRILETDPLTADAPALDWMRQQLARSPQDPILLSRLAALAERDGNWKDAAASYERALTASEQFVPAMLRLAQLYANRLNDPVRAMTLARRARALEPDDPIIAETLGNLAAQSARTLGDHQWAFGLLQESAQKLPDRPDLLINLGLAAFKLGRVEEAAAAMQNALKVTPRSPRAEEAETYLRLNSLARDPAAAVAAASEVSQILGRRPDYLPGLWVQAQIEEQRGNYPAARDQYEKVMTLAPGFAPANKALAVLYLTRLNDPAKAYDYAVKAREAFP